MRTRGALLWDVDQPWLVEDIEIAGPRFGEVAVRLASAGVCYSDQHVVTGSLPSPGFPLLGGHEGAGVLTEVGPGVEGLEVGDHVVLWPTPPCGMCASCQAAQPFLCDGALSSRPTYPEGWVGISVGKHRVYPSSRLGTFSPHAVVNAGSVVKIDPAVPLGVACLLSCAVLSGHGAATRSAMVRAGEDVAVVGLGGVGMSAVQGAVGAGARYVFAIDPSNWKRNAALAFGATHCYAGLPSAVTGIADVTRGLMARKVVIAVGRVDGKDVDNWLVLTAKGGTCVLAALGDVADTDVTANLAINILLQKRLQGSLLGDGNPRHDIPLLASMYLSGKLNLDDLVTREYPLGHINEAFADMLSGNLIRGVIRYTEEDWAL